MALYRIETKRYKYLMLETNQNCIFFDHLRIEAKFFTKWCDKVKHDVSNRHKLKLEPYEKWQEAKRRATKIGVFIKWQKSYNNHLFQAYRKQIIADAWQDKRLARKLLLAWYNLISATDPQAISAIRLTDTMGSVVFTKFSFEDISRIY